MSQNAFDIRRSINGDTVIGFTSVKQMKTKGWMDASKVAAYLMDDDDKTHRKHLGLINLFATTHNRSVPMMRDLFKNAAVLNVEPGQSITYDLPVNRTEVHCYTAEDTSTKYDYPGIDETIFELVLSQEFTKGDILTYDPQYGEQLMVSNDHEVQQVGENFRHFVLYSTNDKTKWFPNDKLKPGIKYFKLRNVIGEFDTDYSGIDLLRNPTGTITNEFLLGDPMGVETAYTSKAAAMRNMGMKTFANDMTARAQDQLKAFGGENKEMFFIAKPDAQGNINKNNMMIGNTLEYLALAELQLMEAHSLMFTKAATFRTGAGTKMVNEGVWHQIRRGKLIKYAKPGGITLDHLREAAQYIFRNSNIPPLQRRIKFKVGWMAHQNVMQLFREEAIQQLTGIPGQMIGTDAQIKPLFSGTLDNLHMNAVQITSVQIPNLGTVEVEYDESMDYQPLADRFSQGFFGAGGFAHTSHSMVIYDASAPEYSNVEDKVKGAKLVEDGSKTSNIYYVKPEGPNVVYGYEQGRMANKDQTSNVQSSLKYRGRTFWATAHSAALVLDTTRYVVIELQDRAAR